MIILDRQKILSLKAGSNDEDLLFHFRLVLIGMERVLSQQSADMRL